MAELGPENIRIEAEVERLAGHNSQAHMLDSCAAAWEADLERLGELEEAIDETMRYMARHRGYWLLWHDVRKMLLAGLSKNAPTPEEAG